MKKLISEDSKMYNVNRQQSGVTARQDSKGDTAPQPNKVSAFIDANKKDDNTLAPKLKPYPLNFVDEMLSDLYLSSVNLRKIILNAEANPALKEKYKKHLKYANDRIELINRAVVDISIELDKINNDQ
jgi:hypothetical protein